MPVGVDVGHEREERAPIRRWMARRDLVAQRLPPFGGLAKLAIAVTEIAGVGPLAAAQPRAEGQCVDAADVESGSGLWSRRNAVVGEGGTDVEPASIEPFKPLGILLHVSCALGEQIEHRIEVGIRARAVADQRYQRRARDEPHTFQCVRSDGPEMCEIFPDVRQLEHRPVWHRQRRLIRREYQHVDIGREKNVVRRKVPVYRFDHAQYECVIDFIEVQPLPEHAGGCEVAAHALVELVREQSTDAAHPGVRRLGENQVERRTRRREIALGIVVHKLRPLVVEHAAVHRIKRVRPADHLRFDVDRHQLLQLGAAEQEMARHAGAVADDGASCGVRCMRERNHRQQYLRRFIAFEPHRHGRVTHGLKPEWRNGCIGFAVRRERVAAILRLAHTHGGGAPVLVKHHIARSSRWDASVAVHATREHSLIEAHIERGGEHDQHGSSRHTNGEAARLCVRAAGEEEQPHADPHVEHATDNQQCLEPHERKQQHRGQRRADDRTERVHAVHRADGALAAARREQHAGDERERDAGAKGGRQHHRERNAVLGDGEEPVPLCCLVKTVDQRGHPAKRREVRRQRDDRQRAHRPLRHTECAHRVAKTIGTRAHPEGAEGEPQNERRQHELERVRGAAEHQRQHAHPADLVDETRQRRAGRHHEQHPPEHGKVFRHACARRKTRRRGEATVCRPARGRQGDSLCRVEQGIAALTICAAVGCETHGAEHAEPHEHIDDRGREQRARKAREFNQIEPGEQNTDRGADRVREIQHRHGPPAPR